jgi:hypothetical protein
MIKIMFLFGPGCGNGAEHPAPISASSHFAPRSFAGILETMT